MSPPASTKSMASRLTSCRKFTSRRIIPVHAARCVAYSRISTRSTAGRPWWYASNRSSTMRLGGDDLERAGAQRELVGVVAVDEDRAQVFGLERRRLGQPQLEPTVVQRDDTGRPPARLASFLSNQVADDRRGDRDRRCESGRLRCSVTVSIAAVVRFDHRLGQPEERPAVPRRRDQRLGREHAGQIARATSMPDFGRNVPISTASGSEEETRRASPLQAAQAAAIAATNKADARTRIADICRSPTTPGWMARPGLPV